MRSLAILLLSVTPVWAIDFNKHLLGPDAKPVCVVEIKDGGSCPEDKLFNLKMAAINALYGQYKGEENLSGEQRYRRGKIADMIDKSNGDLKLKIEDAAEVKKLIGQAYGPLIVKQAWDIIDGESK